MSSRSFTFPIQVLVGPKHLKLVTEIGTTNDGVSYVDYPPDPGPQVLVPIRFRVPEIYSSFPDGTQCRMDLNDGLGEVDRDLPQDNEVIVEFIGTGIYPVTAMLFNDVETWVS